MVKTFIQWEGELFHFLILATQDEDDIVNRLRENLDQAEKEYEEGFIRKGSSSYETIEEIGLQRDFDWVFLLVKGFMKKALAKALLGYGNIFTY